MRFKSNEHIGHLNVNIIMFEQNTLNFNDANIIKYQRSSILRFLGTKIVNINKFFTHKF